MTTAPLKIEHLPIGSVTGYERNARLHSPEQVSQIAASIKQFGFVNPILIDRDSVCVAGHGRIQAAAQLGLTTVPVIRLGHLSPAEAAALRIADNAIPLHASWDESLLRAELLELREVEFDLALTGFLPEELQAFLNPANPGEADPEEAPPVPATPVVRPGDLWLMGEHRLLCGDSTKAEDVARLFGGLKPKLMVTDPPYGVDYDPNWRNQTGIAEDGTLQRIKTGRVRKSIGAKAIGKVSNDHRSDWREAWALFPGNVAYCWHAGRHASDVDLSFRAEGFEVRSQIIWNKMRMIIGRGDYHWAHEPCWYLVRQGKTGGWAGDRKQTTVWDIQHRASETGHSTQKPVECMRRPMENSSRRGDWIYEPFCGSGTSLVAAEQAGRRLLAVEIDPGYVQVAVERFATFVGSWDGIRLLEADGKTKRTFEEVQAMRAPKASRPVSSGKTRKPSAEVQGVPRS